MYITNTEDRLNACYLMDDYLTRIAALNTVVRRCEVRVRRLWDSGANFSQPDMRMARKQREKALEALHQYKAMRTFLGSELAMADRIKAYESDR